MADKPRVRVNKHGLIGDGLGNVVTGVGGNNAKVSANQYRLNIYNNDMDLAYRTSTWYGKILHIPVDDSVKEWRKWQADKEVVAELEREESRLDYVLKVREARLIARHRGGAVILPLGLPGTNEAPLNLEAVRFGSITKLHVMQKDEITPGPIIRDPFNPNYGEPEYWTIGAQGSQARIHPSRVYVFNGRLPPGLGTFRSEFWGDPIYEYLSESIVAADAAAGIVSALMHEAKLDIVTIPGLADMLMTQSGEDRVTRRWALNAQLKSIANIMMLDGGPGDTEGKKEEWSQKQFSWTGIPDVVKTLLLVMAGAADIPMTRLTGEQQTGLSGADVGSLRNYYDRLAAEQRLEMTPMMAGLDELLIRSALGSRPPEIWYTWNDLWQADEKTQAETDKLEAETAVIYANSALLPSSAIEKAVQNRMIESGRWPGLEDALAEAEAAGEEPGDKDMERMEAELAITQAAAEPKMIEKEVAKDAAPRTLYVMRPVLNASEIIAWAKGQGFKTALLPDDMHVTIVYSRTPMDWMKIPEPWEEKLEIAPGGPRLMDQFGEARVLLFKSNALEWRHESAERAGASYDHGEYQPHITISYDPSVDISGMEAYQGRIVLGPEEFSEVKEGWVATEVEEA